jgi:hypothetical protein
VDSIGKDLLNTLDCILLYLWKMCLLIILVVIVLFMGILVIGKELFSLVQSIQLVCFAMVINLLFFDQIALKCIIGGQESFLALKKLTIEQFQSELSGYISICVVCLLVTYVVILSWRLFRMSVTPQTPRVQVTSLPMYTNTCLITTWG